MSNILIHYLSKVCDFFKNDFKSILFSKFACIWSKKLILYNIITIKIIVYFNIFKNVFCSFGSHACQCQMIPQKSFKYAYLLLKEYFLISYVENILKTTILWKLDFFRIL